jgi:hypothetical protein
MAKSPIGNFPEVANAYASSFARQDRNLGQAGDQYNTQVQVENARAAASAHAQQIADLADPSKYKRVPKQDGGFDFIGPDGQQVDIATLASRTNTDPSDWVKDSNNPIDVQYLNDYSNMKKFMDAVVSKDTNAIKQFTDSDPNLSHYQSKGGLQQLLQDFHNTYQRYYVTRAQNPQAWGYAPGNPVVNAPQTDSGSSLSQLQQLLQAAQGQ